MRHDRMYAQADEWDLMSICKWHDEWTQFLNQDSIILGSGVFGRYYLSYLNRVCLLQITVSEPVPFYG